MIDPDGNLFFLAPAFICGFANGAFWSYVQQDMAHKPIDGWNILGKGLIGGLASYASSYSYPDRLKTNVLAGAIKSAAPHYLNNLVDGKDNAWEGVGSAALIGAAYGFVTTEHFGNLMDARGLDSYADETVQLFENRDFADLAEYCSEKYDFEIDPDILEIDIGRSDEGLLEYEPRTGKILVGKTAHHFVNGRFRIRSEYRRTFPAALYHESRHHLDFTGPQRSEFLAHRLLMKASDPKNPHTIAIEGHVYQETQELVRTLRTPRRDFAVWKNQLDQMGLSSYDPGRSYWLFGHKRNSPTLYSFFIF